MQIQRRVEAHVLVCCIPYAMYRTQDRIARTHHPGGSTRKILRDRDEYNRALGRFLYPEIRRFG